MSRKKMTIDFDGPILPGSISLAASQCGKANCACKETPPKLHGPYHRWTGFIDGKRTSRTLTKEEAEESEKRIRNYRAMQKKVDRLLAASLKAAPWLGE
jgi:hypothetical protein